MGQDIRETQKGEKGKKVQSSVDKGKLQSIRDREDTEQEISINEKSGFWCEFPCILQGSLKQMQPFIPERRGI